MDGTVAGGKHAAETNKRLYGDGFYVRIGRLGGLKEVPKGFSKMTYEQRSAAGKIGGTKSKRGPAR